MYILNARNGNSLVTLKFAQKHERSMLGPPKVLENLLPQSLSLPIRQ